jgi:hypothetical protein
MPTRDEILASSQELVAQLQAAIRSDQEFINLIRQTLTRFKEQGSPYIAEVEAQLQTAQKIQQDRQALLGKLVQQRTAVIEAFEKAEG